MAGFGELQLAHAGQVRGKTDWGKSLGLYYITPAQ